MEVQQVLWGSGSYEPEVSRTSSPSIATFFQGVTNSPYVDWLTEYNTAGLPAPTTNQTIGRGRFGQQVTITPSGPGATGTTVDDTAIQTRSSPSSTRAISRLRPSTLQATTTPSTPSISPTAS